MVGPGERGGGRPNKMTRAQRFIMAAMIVVFGSLNVDLILAVPAFPRPGETTLTQSYDIAPGGKGANQALAAARALGEPGRVAMAGMIGDDAWGRTATALLTQAGVDLAHVGVSAQPTGCAAASGDAAPCSGPRHRC